MSTDTVFKWATVTRVSPLAIKLDGDSAALPLAPDTLVDPSNLAVGKRVRTELSKRKVLVHGVAGGVPVPAPTPAPDLSGYLKLGQTLVGSDRTSSGTPFIELLGNTGSQATLHMSNGNGFTGPYQFGLGNDFMSTPGFLLANKANGPGFYLDNHPTATNVAMLGFQRSNAAFMDIVAAKGGAGPLLMLRLNGGVTPTDDQRLITTYSTTGELFAVSANNKVGFFGKMSSRGAQIPWASQDVANMQSAINSLIATLINFGLIYPN